MIVRIEIKNEKNPVNVIRIFDNYVYYKRGLIKAILQGIIHNSEAKHNYSNYKGIFNYASNNI